MGAGLAVVSNAGFGKHTHIEHLVTGVRVPVVARGGRMEMDGVAWSGWLARLAADEQLRQKLGTTARSVARSQFPVERMAAGLIAVFDDAINNTDLEVPS